MVKAPHLSELNNIEKFISEKKVWIYQKLAKKKALNREGPKREFVRVRSKINLHFQGLRHPHGKARGGRIAGYLTDEQRSPAGWIGSSKCEVIFERALNGQGFLYLGKSYRLKFIDDAGIKSGKLPKAVPLRLWHGYFELAESEKTGARNHFVSWYRKQIKRQLKERVPRYDKRIGVTVKDIRILDLGHRWASCGRNGIINFNWRSVMAPIWVFDYVLVHELVHIVERGHTDRFWRLVGRVIPDYEEHARWLNENGADLDL